jgi:hypothetical protein
MGEQGCVPPLVGPEFVEQWNNQTLDRLYGLVKDTMPLGNVDSLAAEDYIEIVAYLLRENGFPAGANKLPAQVESLRTITLSR